MFTFLPIFTMSMIACGDKNTDTGLEDSDTGMEDTDTQDSDTGIEVEDTDTGSEDTETGDTDPEDTNDTEDTNDSGDTSTDTIVLDDELQNPSGCGDFLFFDRNVDDSIVMEIRGQGLAEMAHSTNTVQEVFVDLSQPNDFRLMVNVGSDLSHTLCNDALDPNIVTIIDTTYLPVNGTLNLQVTANGQSMGFGDFPAEMEVLMEDVEFCADIGNGSINRNDCFTLDEYTATVSIGWLMG